MKGASKTTAQTVTPAANYNRKVAEASRLGVSLRTLDSWLAEGRIPYFKVGRCVLLSPPEVDIALARFHVGPATVRKRRAIRNSEAEQSK